MERGNLNEVRHMQKIAGILRENDNFDLSDNPLRGISADQKEFLNAVFELFNDEMRSGNLPEEYFDTIVNYIKNNEREVAEFDNGNLSGVKQAVEYLMDQI